MQLFENNCSIQLSKWLHSINNRWEFPSFFFFSRFHRSATHQQPLSWVTTDAMTSSHEWFLQTHSRLKLWWTSFELWTGLMCPQWPRKAVTGKREWRLLLNSPRKQVRVWALFCSHSKLYCNDWKGTFALNSKKIDLDFQCIENWLWKDEILICFAAPAVPFWVMEH